MSSVVRKRSQIGVEAKQSRFSAVFKEMRAYKMCYLFIAPYAILFVVFTVVPVVMAILLSFTYFNMLQPPQWVGMHNYIRLFLEDEVFLIAVKNTLIYAAITGPVSYLLCFVTAWLINELKPKVRAVLTLLFYAPSISGNAYVIWRVIFSGDTYGIVNGFLLYYGWINAPIQWLLDPDWIMPIVILVVLWMSLGTGFWCLSPACRGWIPGCTKPAPSTESGTGGRSCGTSLCLK